MANEEYSMVGLHLPENRSLVAKLKKIAFGLSLAAAILVITRLEMSVSGVILMLMAITLMLKTREGYGLFTTVCGGVVFLAGSVFLVNNWPLFQGSSFLLLGTGLLLSQTKIGHRYHVVHMLVSIVAIWSGVIWVSDLYKLALPNGEAVIIELICLAILFRWPNRGIVGMFTLDTVSTKFSLRLVVTKVFLIVAIGFVMVMGIKYWQLGNMETVLIMTILLVIITIIMAWINIKLLYKFDLEHLLMKEALRVNNASFKISNEELAKKMIELEESHGKVLNKLNYQDKFRTITENLN